MTPLLAAAVTGHIHIVEFLISTRSDMVTRKERIDALALMTDTEGSWELDERLTQLATSLDVSDLLTRRLSSLSGGQRKRVALAAALAQDADILLLDEPTNHLDWQAIDWLADHLERTRACLLLVTHDRYFLENICNHIPF